MARISESRGDFAARAPGATTFLLATCVFLAGASASGGLRAEESSPPKNAPAERIQVTATRIPEPQENVPASISIVTGEELRRVGAYDLRSALPFLAGVDIAPGSDGGPASSVPELWGLREFDAFLLVIDGIPSGGAFNPALATLDLTSVDRIEVLRGAAPVMYGATSFVGVINVIHRAPGTDGAAVRVGGASYGSGNVAWSTALPQWAGVGSSLDADVTRQGFSDDRTNFDRGHLRWRNGRSAGKGAVHFEVDSTWLRQNPASPHPREGEDLSPLVPLDANNNPKDARIDERRQTVNGVYERPAFSGSWSTTLSLSGSDQGILRGFLSDLTTTTDNAHGFSQTISTTDIYFDSHVSLVPAKNVSLVAGIDHLHGDGETHGGDFDYSVGFDGSGAPPADSLVNASSVRVEDRRDFSGLYTQVEWTALPHWRFEVGVRLNYTDEYRKAESIEFATSTSEGGDDRRSQWRGGGTAGFTWTAWQEGQDALHLYADYRNTYKPAAIDFGLEAETEILAPETAESYEGGLKSTLAGGHLAVDFSVFQMEQQNLVVARSVGGNPGLENAGEARFRGAEVEAAWRVLPGLLWSTSYSLHDARFLDYVTELDPGVPTQLAGNRLEMSARNMASTGVTYGRGEGWQGFVRVDYIGSRFLNKRNTALAPAYTTWGAGLGYRARDVEYRLDAYNLNDTRPPVSESELGDAQYYRLPARRLEASVLWRY